MSGPRSQVNINLGTIDFKNESIGAVGCYTYLGIKIDIKKKK